VIRNFDHVTVVVRDIEAATAFFALLGFVEERSVTIAGERMARYMGVAGIEARHVTLVLRGREPRTEVQLLQYRRPDPMPDPHVTDLTKLGVNHVCFAVDDLAGEVERLTAHGVRLRNEVMDFNGRRLVFLVGPEGITVELAQRGGMPARR
jgi:catechol 2,3-dioxygenase-like lactoylglutathione lyase family enzyme